MFRILNLSIPILSITLSAGAAPGGPATSRPGRFDPGPGKTLLLIGQTFTSEFDGYVSGLGRAPAGSAHYGELYAGAINQGDDGRGLAHLRAVRGAWPCAYANVAISWKDNPDLSDHPRDACGDFTGGRIYRVNLDIVRGRYDAALDSLAAVMRASPSLRFLVRIEYEVGRYLFTWKDASRCPPTGASLDFSDTARFDPEAYRKAFNHVARRLRDHSKVTNAAFVYHPVRGFEDALALYPGPGYVDFIALSLFNHDLCVGAEWCAPADTLDPNARKVLEWGRTVAHKPLMIAEAAPQPPATSSDAGFTAWLDRLLRTVEGQDVRVLSYINSDWTAHGWDARYWGDSRLEARPAVKSWWQARVLDNPRYVHYGCEATGVTPMRRIAGGADLRLRLGRGGDCRIDGRKTTLRSNPPKRAP